MAIDIQVFEKGPDRIVLAWEKDASASIKSFNVYVSLIPGTAGFSLIAGPVSNIKARDGKTKGHVGLSITETVLQALGGGFATATFENTPLYFRVTTINTSDSESAIATATTRAVGAIGVRLMAEQDDEKKNNHNYGYAPELNQWHRQMSASQGALSVSNSGLYEDNLTITRTLSGGNVATELVHVTGAIAGSRAKLYTYTGPFATDGTGRATVTVVSESVVP